VKFFSEFQSFYYFYTQLISSEAKTRSRYKNNSKWHVLFTNSPFYFKIIINNKYFIILNLFIINNTGSNTFPKQKHQEGPSQDRKMYKTQSKQNVHVLIISALFK